MSEIELKLKRYNKDAYQVLGTLFFGQVVGMILRMSDESWGVFNGQEKRLTKTTFERPSDAFEAFKTYYHAGVEHERD